MDDKDTQELLKTLNLCALHLPRGTDPAHYRRIAEIRLLIQAQAAQRRAERWLKQIVAATPGFIRKARLN